MPECDPHGEVLLNVEIIEKQSLQALLVEDSLRLLENWVHVKEGLEVEDIDIPIVFLQKLAIDFLGLAAYKFSIQGVRFISFGLDLILHLLFTLLLLPREGLQHLVGIVMSSVNPIPIDAIVTLQGRGQPFPAVVA